MVELAYRPALLISPLVGTWFAIFLMHLLGCGVRLIAVGL